MDGKTEVINMKAINKNLKDKRKKRKLNLGVYKYFIAIGGVLIATIIFITMWMINAKGGLITIDMDTYLTYNKAKENRVVYIGSNDTVSKELTPVLQKIAKKRHKQYEYLNVEKLKDNELSKIKSVFDSTKDFLVLPTILVIENGKIKDIRTDKTIGIPSGMKLGFLNEKELIKFLEENKVY